MESFNFSQTSYSPLLSLEDDSYIYSLLFILGVDFGIFLGFLKAQGIPEFGSQFLMTAHAEQLDVDKLFVGLNPLTKEVAT